VRPDWAGTLDEVTYARVWAPDALPNAGFNQDACQ
jgi:hypothetical protein